MCVTAETSAVSAWKRRVKLCPGERGRNTAWWMWMGCQIATFGFLISCPSNTQGTGLRRDRNRVWDLKEIKPRAGISSVSERTFCESAGRHPTLEFYAITCHIQPSHWWFTIIIKIKHMRFSPEESAIKERIFKTYFLYSISSYNFSLGCILSKFNAQFNLWIGSHH